MSIIEKIKSADLKGRGGAAFPVATKWEAVKKSSSKKKYVVCNCSEGEPDVAKDFYILDKYADKVINGMLLAIDYLSEEGVDVVGYFYVNGQYFNLLEEKLRELVYATPIILFRKDHSAGYIGGEETALLNHLEGEKVEPRLKPPYPVSQGLYGKPTIVNNVETFLDVCMVSNNAYQHFRYFTIAGDCLWGGVYEYPETMTIAQILKDTKNWPDFNFFVQVGGGASGEVFGQDQLDRPACGAASVTIYSMEKHKPIDVIRKWVKFFKDESCGQCTPCREGTYRLLEILESDEQDWKLFSDILTNLSDSSFCALGASVPVPIRSYISNVISRTRPMNPPEREDVYSIFEYL